MPRCPLTDEPRLTPEHPVSGASAKSVPDREQLILEHLWQVHKIARQIQTRMPGWISLDDLQAVGILGLMAAVDRYEAKRQVSLRTYAEHKIRSFILDSLRDLDWASREQRKRIRLLAKTIALLEQKHQRAPTDEEIAAALGMTLPQYQAWRSTAQDLTPYSLDAPVTGHEHSSLIEVLADSTQAWPSALAERAEQEHCLREAIKRLPEREQTIVRLYYQEELTLAETAQVMRLHESRVSQLKSRAVQQLRSSLLSARGRHSDHL